MPRDNPESITRVHYSGPEGTILSAIHNPQSTIHNLQSTIHIVQCAIDNLQLSMLYSVRWFVQCWIPTLHRSSLLRPLRRSHGLCVFILINTNALRSLQRGCTKLLQLHGHGSDCASHLRLLRSSHAWALCVCNCEYHARLWGPCRRVVGKLQLAMGFNYASLLAKTPAQQPCMQGFVYLNTNALRSLQRGCSCNLCTKCEGQSAKIIAIYTLQSTLCDVQSTICNSHALCNVRSTSYNPHCTMCNLQSIHIVQCAISNLQSTLYNVQSAIYNLQSTLYNV